jgi:hypothetical protein
LAAPNVLNCTFPGIPGKSGTSQDGVRMPHFIFGADGRTRTGTACATNPSS